MLYLGDFADNSRVDFAFTTNAADGGRESTSASLEEGDITIYSTDGDGTWTAMTLDASTITISENPGSQVGVYLISVDMNNDADFTTGKDYVAVFYPDETVDSQSIAAVLAQWSCENRSDTTGILTDTEAILSDSEAVLTDSEAVLADTEAAVPVLTDTEAILSDTEQGITERSTLLTDTEAVLADSEAVLTDTNELQGDWTDGGRLDLILDAILSDTEGLSAGSGLTPLASGTAQGGTTSTIQLAAGESFADDELNGNIVKVTSGTGAGQARLITDYTGSTDTATVTPSWTTTPSTDSVYEVVEGSVNLVAVGLTAQTAGDIIADTEAVLVDSEAILSDTELVLTDSEAILADTEAASLADILTDTEAVLADTEASQTSEASILTDTEAVLTDSEAVLADSEAIVADTNELQGDWTNGGRLDLILDAVLADTEAAVPVLTDTEAILADTEQGITERSTLLTDTEAILTDSEAVLADTELWDSAHTEPSGVPAANETPLDKLGYLFMGLRNKVTVTSSKKTFYDDSDTAEFEKDLSDNGTTYTESEANAI